MPRTPGFPDSRKASEAKPGVIVPAERVLALYNNAHPGSKQYKKVSPEVQEWFKATARADGWNFISFHSDVTGYTGLGAVLKRKFESKSKPVPVKKKSRK